jgi:predicted AAA+ superfamily ATPase
MEIKRNYYINKIKELLKETPVVALIGPRQVGKTTLARMIAAEYPEVTFFDLENPASLSKLHEPLLALQNLSGLIIIDEIQHAPDLFKVLRFLVDQSDIKRNFLVLGSASPVLLSQSSESLAGRIAYVEIHGFSLQEVGKEHWEKLWLRGSFPRAYLASTENGSVRWREEFIRTFLERDLPQLGIKVPAITMRRFWMMLAHYHGQIWNSAEFARAFGMSDKAVRHYLDILTSTFIVRQLAPWWENISKRQVKAPKIFLNDSGLLHTLLGLDTKEELESHPKVGASWEGFAMNTVLTQLNIQPDEAFFWSTYTGAELDLVVIKGNTRIGFEFKRSSAPQMTKSISIALKDLRLSHVYVVYVGNEQYPLEHQVTALGLTNILTTIKRLRE